MAVGSIEFPHMHAVSGIKLGTACAGIKQTERDDLLLIEMTENSTCAAVFTQNAFCAAPVLVAKEHLVRQPRYLLINSGNANAGTGEPGLRDARETCTAVAKLGDVSSEQVLPFSTGVIGEPLPVAKLIKALPELHANLIDNNWDKAAHAIMTTDTFAKGYSKVFEISGQMITITGISKGAGMIQPNMATMLGFLATDAKISQENLQKCLVMAVEPSFNRITVDGDTSTNDACVLMASGKSLLPEIMPGPEDTWQSLGRGWANANNTPFRLFKQFDHEGGIRVPLIVQWPEVINDGGQITHQTGHVIDLLPTVLDAAGVSYPDTFEGRPVNAPDGKSMVPVIRGEKRAIHDVLFWHHAAGKAVLKENWKLVKAGNNPWELYDLDSDPIEMNNLAIKHPDRVAELNSLWENWRKQDQEIK